MPNADDFDVFYTGSVLRVTGQMYPILGSRAAAEYCVREAYAGAWHRWGTVSRKADREALIRTVAFRVSVCRWYRRHPAARDDPGAQASQPAVIWALRQLQVVQRQAIVLHYLVGKPVNEVAREIGIPARTVRARLSRDPAGLAVIAPDPGALLAEAAAEVTAMITPWPAQLIRQRGDSLRRAEALRVLAAVLVLAAIGGAVFALSAVTGP